MKITLENNLLELKKLRKLVIKDIQNLNQVEESEDAICELEEWLNEIENNIVRLKKRTKLPTRKKK